MVPPTKKLLERARRHSELQRSQGGFHRTVSFSLAEVLGRSDQRSILSGRMNHALFKILGRFCTTHNLSLKVIYSPIKPGTDRMPAALFQLHDVPFRKQIGVSRNTDGWT